jgi:regulatory protein
MQITEISKIKNKIRFLNIVIGNKDKYVIHKDVVVKYGLKKEDEISENDIGELLHQNEFHIAKDTALRYLSYRQRTEYELKKKLTQKKFKIKIIDSIVKNFQRIGLINDNEFAESFCLDILKKKGVGKSLLKHKLLSKGIPKEIIASVIEKTFKGINEKDIAYQIAKKQLKKYEARKTRSSNKENQIRLSNFLAQRGFSWDIITQITHQLFKNKLELENEKTGS